MLYHINDITSQITIHSAKFCENFKELRKEKTLKSTNIVVKCGCYKIFVR